MKNYIKKDTFTPISMKCTEEQFEEIKPILDNFKIYNNCWDWYDNSVLVNNASDNILNIGNYDKYSIKDYNRTYHKKFNAKTFLNACGIFEVEETLPIKKSTLLQLAENNSFSEEIIKKEFPQLFESKLEVGKWYKDKFDGLMCYNGIGKSYGFDCNKKFSIDNEKSWFNFKIENNNIPATEQEVFEALKNEAVKRGYKNEVTFTPTDANYKVTRNGNSFGFLSRENRLLYCNYSIFENGTWAEIIDQPKEITISEIEKILGYKILIKE